MLPAVFVYIEVKDYVPDTYAGKKPDSRGYFHMGPSIFLWVSGRKTGPKLGRKFWPQNRFYLCMYVY